MKKLFLLLFVVSVFSFAACESVTFVGDEPVDEVAVHNGLVERMDALLGAEETFFDIYFVMVEGDSVSDLRVAYDDFVAKVNSLDSYFVNTKFAEGQQVFVEEYNNYYKSFLVDYVAYAGDFLVAIDAGGLTPDIVNSFQDDLDAYTADFIDLHYRLIGTINLQSDFDPNVVVEETIN